MLESLTCDQCGARLRVDDDARVVTCRHCNAQLQVRAADAASQGRASATRSENTNVAVSITFVNKRGAPIELFWLDFEGVARSFGRAELAGSRNFNTFVKHVWSIRDAASGAEVLRWWAPDANPRTVEVS